MNINMLLRRCLPFALLLMIQSVQAQTVLRYTDHEPLGNMRTKVIKDVFFSAIEQESKGRLRIDDRWNGELSVSYDALKTISEGKKADMGVVVPEYTAAKLPLHQLFKSFPLGPDNGEKQVAFFHRAFSELPQFSAELAANNLVNLQFFVGYPAAFFTPNPKLKLDHLNGTTWRTASFWHQSYLENAGAKVVKMPWNEQITDALRSGQLSGLLVNLDSGDDIHAWQAAKEIRVSPRLWLGHVYLLAMNKQRWDALAQEDKDAIRRAAVRTEKVLGITLDTSLKAMTETLNQQGAHVTSLTAQQLDAWQRTSRYQQVQADWVAQQQAKGVKNADATLKALSLLLKQVQ
ncbi:TRAP transporter substrate-binding protein DctP [Scandinavium sp. M-37]|jgi:TRAP-type C4-dicarboxylate transport system substrate-binding protein|uniref:TRAP transporter substrate-binding protein DctP n=1 Tax=Scandinavium sp. M-37 TaxID=3373077 RepID=UPI003747626A